MSLYGELLIIAVAALFAFLGNISPLYSKLNGIGTARDRRGFIMLFSIALFGAFIGQIMGGMFGFGGVALGVPLFAGLVGAAIAVLCIPWLALAL